MVLCPESCPRPACSWLRSSAPRGTGEGIPARRSRTGRAARPRPTAAVAAKHCRRPGWCSAARRYGRRQGSATVGSALRCVLANPTGTQSPHGTDRTAEELQVASPGAGAVGTREHDAEVGVALTVRLRVPSPANHVLVEPDKGEVAHHDRRRRAAAVACLSVVVPLNTPQPCMSFTVTVTSVLDLNVPLTVARGPTCGSPFFAIQS